MDYMEQPKTRMPGVHLPVMLQEVLSYLAPRAGGCYVDMTVGAGGHARALMERLQGKGRVIGIDRDAEVLPFAKATLRPYSEGCSLHCLPFSQIAQLLQELKITALDGALFDLGVSSYQLDQGRRGFSLSREGPLDMRMGSDAATSAEEILCRSSEQELGRIFWEYGEEPRARKIAAAVVKARQRHVLRSTLELAHLVAEATGYTHGRIHPATRIFQALRIAVNKELQELPAALAAIVPYLMPGGRLVVISFHSLEDRIVKEFVRQQPMLASVTEKPVTPSRQEERQNHRSRSAKLRCAEKIGSDSATTRQE
jgi:16S rRNA (cytosine1402-N4)-methyltransferase